MIYLLAKYTLLFLLTAVLGFVLGYWWSRRNFVDVSESYEELRKATETTDEEANWERLWKRLDAIPEPRETDLSTVFERLDSVHSAIAKIPEPATIDFMPVESRLDSLAGQIANIPAPDIPEYPDLRPLTDHVAKLEQKIRAIPAPTDIVPLIERLRGLETTVRSIPAPLEIDLQPVHDELSSISKQINGLPKVETNEPVNIAPVVRQIDALEKRVCAIPHPGEVDLKPIEDRLRSIETRIDKVGNRLTRGEQLTQKPKNVPSTQRAEEPRILSAALYGKKDNLKLISGVGPRLEGLLNENGVYYFWQVASWSHKDVESIDQKLDVFKGRISRDDWVSQAKQLKESPGAARVPTNQA